MTAHRRDNGGASRFLLRHDRFPVHRLEHKFEIWTNFRLTTGRLLLKIRPARTSWLSDSAY
jgi:hypothetical protein